MKVSFYFITAMILTAGCSSSTNVQTKTKTNVGTNVIANQTVTASVNQPNNSVSNTENVNQAVLRNFAISKKNERNWGDKNIAQQTNRPIAENIQKSGTAAPDNSEVFSSMNSKGQPQETRVFKNHAQLNKIERIDLNNSDIKVYLKNGKVLNLPTEKAGIFLTAPAAEILEAVGIK